MLSKQHQPTKSWQVWRILDSENEPRNYKLLQAYFKSPSDPKLEKAM